MFDGKCKNRTFRVENRTFKAQNRIFKKKNSILKFLTDGVSNKTKQHIQILFERFGYDQFFGRTEVMSELSITASPASALIKKMLDWGVIYPMKGKGKGKYLFGRN